MRTLVSSLFFLFCIGLHPVASASIHDGFVNKEVNRDIDLASQFANHKINIIAINQGKQAAFTYHLAVPSSFATHLAFISVQDEANNKLRVGTTENFAKGTESYVLYPIILSKALDPQSTLNITVSLIFTHTMRPYPAQIKQMEPQLVVYQDNVFFLSPYSSITQTTTVKLPSIRVESYTQAPPKVEKKGGGDTIVYGPYHDIEAFSSAELSVHFENSKPFLTITKLIREFEISHWGNLAVEERFWVEHGGAKHTGQFCRTDYQRSPQLFAYVIKSFAQYLPASARDIYYRDEIGNISTSHVSSVPSGIKFEIIPRFPLLGGWKTVFYTGYNLPLEQSLGSSPDDPSLYTFLTPFASNIPDAVVDELEIRVILPEGASDATITSPYPTDGEARGRHFTHLDTAGRLVVSVTKRNVVSSLNQNLKVTYRYHQSSLIRKPLLLVGAFFTLFLFVMLFVRIDISISKAAAAPEALASGAH